MVFLVLYSHLPKNIKQTNYKLASLSLPVTTKLVLNILLYDDDDRTAIKHGSYDILWAIQD